MMAIYLSTFIKTKSHLIISNTMMHDFLRVLANRERKKRQNVSRMNKINKVALLRALKGRSNG